MEPKSQKKFGVSTLTDWWPIRFLIYIGAMLALVFMAKALTNLLIPAGQSRSHESMITLRNLLQAIVMIVGYALIVRKVEGRKSDEVSLSGAATSLSFGILIGGALISLAYIILVGLGVAQFEAGMSFKGIVVAVLKPLVVGTLEELLFRVILFRILQQMAGTLVAVVVSAALFGLAHAGNPGATPLAIVFLTIELGVFLALVYTYTNSLWMVAGLHMGWNFAQEFVFGVDVSGLPSSSSILQTKLVGPIWLTGGDFGMEGSVVTLVVSLIGVLIIGALVIREKRWVPIKFELRAKT